MARSITSWRAPGTPLVMVADRFDASQSGRAALAFSHWATGLAESAGRGPVLSILWTAGPDGWARPDGLAVREIETINSWRLPIELVRHRPTRAAGRALRAGRVRSWWIGLGPGPAVVLLDGDRPELAHYLPPSTRTVVGPDIVTTEVTRALWSRALRRRFAVPDTARLIGGWGPPTWPAGIDQIITAAARPELASDHVVWFLPRSTPMRPEPVHDARALGLEDRFHWCEVPGEPADALVGCDVVLAAGRSTPIEPVRVEGVPCVTYGSEAVQAPGARPEQLAEAVHDLGRHPDLPTDDDLLAAFGWGADQ